MKVRGFIFLLLVWATGALAQQIPPYVPLNGLEAWYGFNGNTNDATGNGHHGVPDSVYLTTDRCGIPNSAYYFNGKNSQILSIDTFFNIGWNYSISCWFNSDSIFNPFGANRNQSMINTKPHNGMEINFNWGGVTNKYHFFAGSNPPNNVWNIFTVPTVSNSNVVVHSWNLMVMVKNGTSYQMYIKGALDNVFNTTVVANNYLCRIVLGNISDHSPETFFGKLDDYGIWNRSLTPAEVLQLYNWNCNPLTANTQSSDASCNLCNGTAAANVLTGSSPYNYSWSNGGNTQTIIGLCAGSYTVTVTDAASNTITAAVTIAQGGSAVIVTVTGSPTQMCSGETASLCVTTGFATYQWNNGETDSCITATQAGNYYVTVTDNNGCTAVSNNLAINVYPQPPVSISVNADTLTAYNAVTYQWYLNGSAITGATNNIYIATQGGLYSVMVTDSNGCTAVSTPVLITGIENLTEDDVVSVNTKFGMWNVECGSNLIGGVLEVFDANGRVVFQILITNHQSLITPALSRGVYLLRISSAKSSVVRKLVRL